VSLGNGSFPASSFLALLSVFFAIRFTSNLRNGVMEDWRSGVPGYSIIDEVVKSQKGIMIVIPAEAGIQ
jgi:hypothetical protein